MKIRCAAALFLVFIEGAGSQGVGNDEPVTIPLTVPAGVPLRLYLTKAVPKRVGALVRANVLGPVYVFDHEVIPSGTQAIGSVIRCESVPKWERFKAVMNGDFTPLRVAQVEFVTLVLPDGSSRPLSTIASSGLNSLYPLRPPKQLRASPQNPGRLAIGKQKIKDQVNAQVDRLRSIPEMVRGPDKKEWLSDFLLSKLPYHPQHVRNRTRFDAELRAPLDFGSERLTSDSLSLLGSQPGADSVVHARLLTPLNSENSVRGQKVEAVLADPLFSADRKVILPEGTHVEGSVVRAKKAGWFHHGGQLRFTFQQVELAQLPSTAEKRVTPSANTALQPRDEKAMQFRTQGTLSAAEGSNAPVKIDSEGGIKATESKTRFLGTALALLVARSAADNDPIRSHTGAITGHSQNVGGRTLGGGMGFGLLGSIAAQSSRNVGAGLGYYGLAWSLYSTVIARGAEVRFNTNAVMDISFSGRKSSASPAH